jgi:hypothetical protein
MCGFFEDNETVLELVVIVVQPCQYIKNHWMYTLKLLKWIVCYAKIISILRMVIFNVFKKIKAKLKYLSLILISEKCIN